LWKFIEGLSSGQTSTDSNRIDPLSVFCHPIDLHLGTRGLSGWPKLSIEVFSVNALKQFYPIGVGFTYLPTKPGFHRVKVTTWRIKPLSVIDSVKERFYTGGFTLIKKDLVHTGVDRFKLSTISSGTVEVEFYLVFKHFQKYNILIK
jgi:Ciliary basal body-associated, B9 protein